jgi:pimeloyl-ACP methyl ester carboxylesterase
MASGRGAGFALGVVAPTFPSERTGHTVRVEMRRVVAPTLVVRGTEDSTLALSAVQAVIGQCPHWRLEPLVGVGHLPAVDTPAELVRVVRDFAPRGKPPLTS